MLTTNNRKQFGLWRKINKINLFEFSKCLNMIKFSFESFFNWFFFLSLYLFSCLFLQTHSRKLELLYQFNYQTSLLQAPDSPSNQTSPTKSRHSLICIKKVHVYMYWNERLKTYRVQCLASLQYSLCFFRLK